MQTKTDTSHIDAAADPKHRPGHVVVRQTIGQILIDISTTAVLMPINVVGHPLKLTGAALRYTGTGVRWCGQQLVGVAGVPANKQHSLAHAIKRKRYNAYLRLEKWAQQRTMKAMKAAEYEWDPAPVNSVFSGCDPEPTPAPAG